MECALIPDYFDGELSPFFRATHHKARKQHRCGECGRTIEPGETYEYSVAKWNEKISSFRTCADCESLRKVWFEGGWFYGTIRDEIKQSIVDIKGEVPSGCIIGLTEAAKAFVFGEIDKVWDELA